MVYGALLGIAGAGAGAYGASEQRRAMRGASRAYDRDLAGYYAREGGANRDFQNQYQGVSDARLNQVGSTLQQYMAPAYGQQPGDTSTIDSALAQFRETNPGAGGSGAAAAWGRGVNERTSAATGRMRNIAGDANMLRRVGDDQSGALLDMGVADQRFGHQLGDIQSMEQLRRADLARQLQGINMRGQKRFDKAGRKGQDWMTAGSLLGAGGQALDAWNATTPQQGQRQFDTGHDVDYFRR